MIRAKETSNHITSALLPLTQHQTPFRNLWVYSFLSKWSQITEENYQQTLCAMLGVALHFGKEIRLDFWSLQNFLQPVRTKLRREPNFTAVFKSEVNFFYYYELLKPFVR